MHFCRFSFVVLLVAQAVAHGQDLDYGDHSSATLTGKAWKSLEAKKYSDAIAYAKKCVELYEKQAVEMQKELKEPVSPDDREAVSKKWALNDVGTCLFITGQAYEKQDKGMDAIAAYKQLIEKVPFAQCWDPKGWFWKPATAAKARIKALEFDSQK
jgi:tetratricopeptide (TPR) repeat protein